MTQYCPICGNPGVPASGPKSAEILIIGEFPGNDEMENGRPFSGPTGRVLKNELRHAGIEFSLCRVANLWLHLAAEPENKTKEEALRVKNLNEKCYKYGLDILLDEAKGRKAILLVGSECANVFVGMGIAKITGMQVESTMLSAPLIYAMLNPAIVFQPNKGVGEIRLALKRFADACQQRGLLDDE